MWSRVKWLFLWSMWVDRVVYQPLSPVRVSNGWVRGSLPVFGSYIQYMGIPYATVVNRFQAPGPEPTWEGVFEAVNSNIRCLQTTKSFGDATDIGPETLLGQEDCLILNIYTPTAPHGPLPVMVFIHGGAFIEGSSEKQIYGPDYFVTKGVVLVTLNYRLNVQGFLCLGIKEAPGNAGLKDQVAALKWVQRNIRVFGGDPDNVTIFGESAGGASVSFHVLSPMSKGLFHKAIQQSGSSIAPWAIQVDPVKTALTKAKAVGYNGTSEDPYDLFKFFESKTDSEIAQRLTKRVEGNTVQWRMYQPCVENEIDGVESIVTELPLVLLREGRYNKVPTIIGSNDAEGILFLNVETFENMHTVKMETLLPLNLVYPNAEEKRNLADEVMKLYMGDDDISADTLDKIVIYYGEPFFNFPINEEAEQLRKTNDHPVYSYMFRYQGWRNFAKQSVKKELKKFPGATHADELFYMFSQTYVPSLFEGRMIEAMTTMWTNFAKYGDPTPEVSELLPVRWPALTAEDQRSFVIDHEMTTAPMWYNNNTLPYWKQVFEKYRRKE